MNREKSLNIISFLLALTFSYAAVSKTLDLQKFQVQLGQSTMLGFIAEPLSILVPIVEIALTVLIFIPRTRIVGFYSLLAMMTMFTTYIVIIMNYSYHIPCSCGGILNSLGWKHHLIFNLLLCALIVLAIVILERSSQRVVETITRAL